MSIIGRMRMTQYQDRINTRLNYLYEQKKDWVRVLRAVHRLGNAEIEAAITRTCTLEMESTIREIERLEGMQGDLKKINKEPNFARHGEDSLLFDNRGLLNEAGMDFKWGEPSEYPPVEPR
jgi:hypothetical protein